MGKLKTAYNTAYDYSLGIFWPRTITILSPEASKKVADALNMARTIADKEEASGENFVEQPANSQEMTEDMRNGMGNLFNKAFDEQTEAGIRYKTDLRENEPVKTSSVNEALDWSYRTEPKNDREIIEHLKSRFKKHEVVRALLDEPIQAQDIEKPTGKTVIQPKKPAEADNSDEPVAEDNPEDGELPKTSKYDPIEPRKGMGRGTKALIVGTAVVAVGAATYGLLDYLKADTPEVLPDGTTVIQAVQDTRNKTNKLEQGLVKTQEAIKANTQATKGLEEKAATKTDVKDAEVNIQNYIKNALAAYKPDMTETMKSWGQSLNKAVTNLREYAKGLNKKDTQDTIKPLQTDLTAVKDRVEGINKEVKDNKALLALLTAEKDSVQGEEYPNTTRNNEEQSANSDERDESWKVEANLVTKRKFDAEDSDIGPYNGIELRLKKDFGRLSTYGKLGIDRAEGEVKDGTSFAELKSTGYTSGLGAELNLVKSEKAILRAYGELLIRMEENALYMRAGGLERDENDSDTTAGWGAGLRLDLKPNEKTNLFIGGGIGEAGENGMGYSVILGGGVSF